MSNDVQPSTGDLVRGALAVAKIGQRDAAKAIGLTQPGLSRRINGHLAFRVDELVKLAALCGVPVETLLSRQQVAA